MNVSTGCERSSRPLTPSSNAVLEQEIRFHVPAAQAVRNVQPDLDAFDFGVRLGLKHRAQNRGRLDQSGGRKDGQGKSRELTACVDHSFQLPAPSFQLPASSFELDRISFGVRAYPNLHSWSNLTPPAPAPNQARTWLEAGSWELEAVLEHEPRAEPEGALAAGGAGDLAEGIAGCGAEAGVRDCPSAPSSSRCTTSTWISA